MATIHVAAAPIASLKDALRASSDAAHKTRIRAIIKLQEGKTKTEVAHELTISRTALIEWVKCYNSGGADALIFGRGGRTEGNPKWNDAIFETLAKEIDKGGYWSIPRMMEWIKRHKKEDIPEQTVWYRMDQLGYSYKGARPHPVQGNIERQETFKKGASSRSWSKG